MLMLRYSDIDSRGVSAAISFTIDDENGRFTDCISLPSIFVNSVG